MKMLLRLIGMLLGTAVCSPAAEPPKSAAEQVEEMITKAEMARYDAQQKAQHNYQVALAKALQFADRAEVYLLDFEMEKSDVLKDDETVFPIRPYAKESLILQRKAVPEKDLPKWSKIFGKLLVEDAPNGVLCHFPIHGLRFFAGDRLLFQTSLCWHCGNYYVDGDFRMMGRAGLELKKMLDEFMPIPATEVARFEIGGQKRKASPAILSLSYEEFDQTPEKGWRAMAKAGLSKDAAELIGDYLSEHADLDQSKKANLHWHALQCFAFAGDTEAALKHLPFVRHEDPPGNPSHWNDYVEATEAFLRNDAGKLLSVRKRMASNKPDDPNVPIVDRLIENFGKPYAEAYGAVK